MKRVWKYPIELNSVLDDQYEVTIDVPAGAVPLCVMSQNGVTCLWAEVDEDATNMPLTLLCVGTGHGAVPDKAHYFGSVINGPYVWHLYIPFNERPSHSN